MHESYGERIQIRDLSWLVALAEHQHVTDTAAIVRTSQPTLSRALARVEAELRTRVFQRTRTASTRRPRASSW